MTPHDVIRDWGLGFFWGNAIESVLEQRYEDCRRWLGDVLANGDRQGDGVGRITPYDVYKHWDLEAYAHAVVIAIHRENPVEAVRAANELLDSGLKDGGIEPPPSR